MVDGNEILGALAALGSAAAWAWGAILFRRVGDFASPLAMNLVKALMGLVLLCPALLLEAGFTALPRLSPSALALMMASGIIGIAAGDTLFFMALLRLQPRRTLLLATVGQIFTVFLAVLFLGERLPLPAWGGIVLVLGGVRWVMQEQIAGEPGPSTSTRLGWVCGILASLCMSAGIILAEMGAGDLSALQGTFLRLLAGAGGLALIGALRGQITTWLLPFGNPELLWRMSGAVLVVILGGFTLSLLALKLTGASVTSILTATEPIFILPMVAVLGEPLSRRAILGACIAVLGVMILLGALA